MRSTSTCRCRRCSAPGARACARSAARRVSMHKRRGCRRPPGGRYSRAGRSIWSRPRSATATFTSASLPCWRRPRPRRGTATRSSRSAPSTVAPPSTLRSTRPMPVRCSRSTCRPTIRPVSASTPASAPSSTSRRSAPASSIAARHGRSRRPRSFSSRATRRPSTGPATRAGRGWCSSTARTPTTMCGRIRKPRSASSPRAQPCSGTTTASGRASPARSKNWTRRASSGCAIFAAPAWSAGAPARANGR
jgi:hypothetical protein